MLEDEKQNILFKIAKAKKSIESDEKTIAKFRAKQNNPSSRLKNWFYDWRIQYEKNDIKTKQKDIEDYEMDLKLTEDAILSQQRDSQLIEDYTYLPRPSVLAEKIEDVSLETSGNTSQQPSQATLLSSILQGMANSINGFLNPKKEGAVTTAPAPKNSKAAHQTHSSNKEALHE